MQEWRNWQTRRLQVPVVAISCGFKSHLLHPFFILSYISLGYSPANFPGKYSYKSENHLSAAIRYQKQNGKGIYCGAVFAGLLEILRQWWFCVICGGGTVWASASFPKPHMFLAKHQCLSISYRPKPQPHSISPSHSASSVIKSRKFPANFFKFVIDFFREIM